MFEIDFEVLLEVQKIRVTLKEISMRPEKSHLESQVRTKTTSFKESISQM